MIRFDLPRVGGKNHGGMMVFQSLRGTACALAVANSRVEDKNATRPQTSNILMIYSHVLYIYLHLP